MTEQAIRGTLAGSGRQSPGPFRPYVYRGSERLPAPNTGPGMCQCGCGEATKVAVKSDIRTGAVKGEPLRYVRGHSGGQVPRNAPRPPGSGRCECGCGELTELATRTDSCRGTVKGWPLRYVRGHNLQAGRAA